MNDYIDDDLLLIEYPNDFAVDVSYHLSTNDISVRVILNCDWDNPEYRKILNYDKIELIKTIQTAIDIAAKG